jgi:hypothetical protein
VGSDRRCQVSSIWFEHQLGALVFGSVQQASRIRLSRANVRKGPRVDGRDASTFPTLMGSALAQCMA